MARARSTFGVALAVTLAGAVLSQGDAQAAAERFLGAWTGAASNAKTATRAVEAAISACQEGFAGGQCVADALEAYSDELRTLPLPSDLQGLPGVAWRPARRLSAAKTTAQASKAFEIVIGEVHRTAARLAADDQRALRAETRDSSFVAESLTFADNKVQRAVSL
jgi:hypothetical protein